MTLLFTLRINYYLFFAKLADREARIQGSCLSNTATNARSYLSQYMTDLQLPVANPQCAAVPLVAQDVISAPASQAFVYDFFQFAVC